MRAAARERTGLSVSHRADTAKRRRLAAAPGSGNVRRTLELDDRLSEPPGAAKAG